MAIPTRRRERWRPGTNVDRRVFGLLSWSSLHGAGDGGMAALAFGS